MGPQRASMQVCLSLELALQCTWMPLHVGCLIPHQMPLQACGPGVCGQCTLVTATCNHMASLFYNKVSRARSRASVHSSCSISSSPFPPFIACDRQSLSHRQRTPLPAVVARGRAGQQGRAEAAQVVRDVPHAPVGAALLGREPAGQDARAARPAEALRAGRSTNRAWGQDTLPQQQPSRCVALLGMLLNEVHWGWGG